MTQEEEIRGIIEDLLMIGYEDDDDYNEANISEYTARIMEWFENWRNR